VRRDALAFLAGTEGPFDLVFADPPYSSPPRLGERLAELLPPVLSPEARIVTESHKRRPVELPFPLVRERVYGDTRIAVHRA
jgi:16S rRNA G966 N2-methylase RsmD